MKNLQLKHIVIFLFFGNLFFAQNKKVIDSLEIEIKKQLSPKKQIELNYLLAYEFVYFDNKAAEKLAKQILQLSQKINYKKGLAYYYDIHADIQNSNENFNKAFELNKKAIQIYKSTKDTAKYLTTGFSLVVSLSYNDKFKEAIELSNKLLKYTKSSKYNIQIAQLYTIMARCYTRKNEYKDALKNFNLAIQTVIKKNKKNNLMIFQCYIGISEIYQYTNQYEKALDYAIKIIEIVKNKEFNNNEKGGAYSQLAGIYISLKAYKKAKIALTESFKYCSEKFHKDLYAFNLTLLATLNLKENRFNEAILNAKKSVALSTYPEYIANANQILGKSYFAAKQYQNAFNTQITVINYINTNENKTEAQENFVELYGEIAKTEAALGNYKSAYQYKVLNKDINDKILQREKNDRINELQTKFNVSEKDNLIKKEKLEQQKKDLQIQKQNYYLTIVSVILGTITLLGFFLVKVYLANKKKNKQLIAKNIIIENTNETLNYTKAKLEELLFAKDVLLKEVHHRVKNNLQIIISLLNIQARTVKNEETSEFVERSLARITSMSLVHQNLYQNDNMAEVDFNEYLINLTESIAKTFNESKDRIKVNINCTDIQQPIETAIPLGLIISELMYNIYKHAFPNLMSGIINIELFKVNNKFKLTIKDNGVGFDEKSNTVKSMGMKLSYLLANQINGTFEKIKSEKTEFLIQFPCN